MEKMLTARANCQGSFCFKRVRKKPRWPSYWAYCTPLLLRKILRQSRSGRPPYSISGASRADSSGSGHLPEQENTMGDSGSDAGASIHASFRNLHRAAAPGVCGVKKKHLFSSSRPSTQLSWTVPTGSITLRTPLINPSPRVRVIHSHVVARARRCDGRRIVSENIAPVKIAPRRPKGGHHQHLRPDRSPYVL